MHWKERFKGLVLSVVAGVAIHFIAGLWGWLNGVMAGLLLGIFIGNFFKPPQSFDAGIKFTGSKMLEFSILFLAFSINFGHLSNIGWQSFLLVIVIVFGILIVSLWLSKKLNCPNSTGWLVGFGTAICGSSAIAAVAPGISKNKEDAGIALAVVNLMGVIGMLLIPLFIKLFQISDIHAGILIGGTLHSVGNVAGAGYSLSESIGDTAISIKMARVAMLSPAVIFFTFLINKKENKQTKDYLKLPYYLWGFIIITIFVSVVNMPDTALKIASESGKIILTIAMFAIGLKVSFRELYLSGRRAITFGIAVFAIQILLVAFALILI
jgi:uncharacterized integral membrane protein (TIGR00698 family)